MKKNTSKKFLITETNHIIINCKVNGTNGRFILDTGASNSCINLLMVNKFNLRLKKYKKNAASATSTINEAYISKNNLFEINNLKKDFEVIVFDMTYINNSLNEKKIEEVDGIIGGDFLIDLNANINYEKKIVTLKI